MYGGESSLLSPRMAELLWETALFLAEASNDEDFLADVREELPSVVQRLADNVWMARFSRCFEVLAARLALGYENLSHLASCTAEEMALHLVIEAAEAGVSDGSVAMDQSLPPDADHDQDFDWVREILFRDHDVLLLFEDSLDGIEDADSAHSKEYGLANLHPDRWFLPFADADSWT
jgi:hypothetical protein